MVPSQAPAARTSDQLSGCASRGDVNSHAMDGLREHDGPESSLNITQAAVPTESPGNFASLPEEILLQVFEHIIAVKDSRVHQRYHPRDTENWINYYGNGNRVFWPDDEIDEYEECDRMCGLLQPPSYTWTPLEVLNVALTCRRFYLLLLPTIAIPFEDWCNIASGTLSAYDTIPGSGPALRAILRQPIRRTYLRQVEVNVTGFRRYAKDDREWKASDYVLADKAVDELCKREIWKAFPVKMGTGWRDAKKDEMEDDLAGKGAAEHWKGCIRDGRGDAIAALFLALSPNIEELVISDFDKAESDDQASTWRVGGDPNYLERIFRAATNSQTAALAGEAGADNSLLPSLRSIVIRTAVGVGQTSMTSISQVLPFLALPSLKSASILALDNDGDFDPYLHEVIDGANPSLESLDILYDNVGCYSAARLLRFFPRVQTLSYCHHGNKVNMVYSKLPKLFPHLAAVAPQLKSMTLYSTGIDGWELDPGFDEIDSFGQLRTLSTDHGFLQSYLLSGGPGALWRTLPASIERIETIVVKHQHAGEFIAELNALNAAREEGLLPNLKEVIVVYWKFDWSSDVAEALEDACASAPVEVRIYFVADQFKEENRWKARPYGHVPYLQRRRV